VGGVMVGSLAAAVLAQREGFHPPTTEEFNWPCITPELFGIGGACLNRVGLLSILAAAITLGFFTIVFRGMRAVPNRRQSLGEVALDFIRDSVILDVVGREGLRYLPYLTTLFFFVFFSNILGIVPFVHYSPTASTATPAFLAILTWIIFNVAGVRKHGGLGYLRSQLFPPGVPPWMYVIMTPIEFMSIFLFRPLTLTVRLAANMIAGHLTLLIFLLGTEYMLEPLLHGELSITEVWAVGAFGIAIAMTAFEVFVGALQAYIFVVLTATYISTSVAEEH
jgi:F-type H+-transporting ATPase subunit a